MKKINSWMDEFFLSKGAGILLFPMSLFCVFLCYESNAPDWLIFIEILGAVFSANLIYDDFIRLRIYKEHSKEFDEIMKVVKPELDAMFAEMMKECSEEEYKQFLVEANKIIDREARRRGRLRVSRSDKP